MSHATAKLLALLDQHHGVFLTRIAATQASAATISRFIAQQGLQKYAPGLYLAPDCQAPAEFLLQCKTDDFIISHQSAAQLTGLIPLPTNRLHCCTSSNTTHPLLPAKAVIHQIDPSRQQQHLTVSYTKSGFPLITYTPERTVCDLFATNIPAVQHAALAGYLLNIKGGNLGQLIDTAKPLHMRAQILASLRHLPLPGCYSTPKPLLDWCIATLTTPAWLDWWFS